MMLADKIRHIIERAPDGGTVELTPEEAIEIMDALLEAATGGDSYTNIEHGIYKLPVHVSARHSDQLLGMLRELQQSGRTRIFGRTVQVAGVK